MANHHQAQSPPPHFLSQKMCIRDRMETQYGEGDAAKSQTIAENYITQGVVGIFGCNEGSTTGTGNAIKASGNANIIGVGFDKSDAIMNLINDGYLLCTMAQNPDVMGEDGVKAAVAALELSLIHI